MTSPTLLPASGPNPPFRSGTRSRDVNFCIPGYIAVLVPISKNVIRVGVSGGVYRLYWGLAQRRLFCNDV